MRINEKIQKLLVEFDHINIDADFELNIEIIDNIGYKKTAVISYIHADNGKKTNLIISRQEWQTEYEICETDIENLNSLYNQAKRYYGKMYSTSRYNHEELYQTKCRICGTIHDWQFYKIDDSENLGFLGYIKSHILTPSLFVCKKCDYETIHDIVSYNQYKNKT